MFLDNVIHVFSAVRDIFADNLASGADLGASFALTINGEMVIRSLGRVS